MTRDYHFGTDIPIPTSDEIEQARANSGEDDRGNGAISIAFLSVLAALALLLIYLVLT